CHNVFVVFDLLSMVAMASTAAQPNTESGLAYYRFLSLTRWFAHTLTLVSPRRAFALTLPDLPSQPNSINKLANSRCGLRLIFAPFHIRFMAKSRAPFGSFCQYRLCSSARRLPQPRAVLASAPLPL